VACGSVYFSDRCIYVLAGKLHLGLAKWAFDIGMFGLKMDGTCGTYDELGLTFGSAQAH